MKKEEIGIRDPYVLLENGTYYLYGTRNTTTWTDADGFDVYVSPDLKEWTKKEIFHNDGSFWATQNYWAPECIRYKNAYYLIATFGSKNRKKGIQILKADRPDGVFAPITAGPLTPEDWNCLDGTFYLDEQGTPWLLFSHSVPEELRGAICAAQLSPDLTKFASKPHVLFYADTAPWSKPIPFAKEEFGVDGDAYFSDGPYLFKDEDGNLCMLWSSWSERGYAMGVSKSADGTLCSEWIHGTEPIFQGGGHGMIFADKNGEKYLTFHAPNETLKEKPVFQPLRDYLR
jgi:beta-xylosidase